MSDFKKELEEDLAKRSSKEEYIKQMKEEAANILKSIKE